MITIHKSGIDASLPDQEIARLQQDFLQNHFVRFPNLINEGLLEELNSLITTAEWEERIHDGIGVEVVLKDIGIPALINFLLNDQKFFQIIQKITGCGTIGCFHGRVYRMIPHAGHYDSWHTDFGEDRLLALSLNLGKKPYVGGVLQIQQNKANSPPIEVPNIQYGHAVLFRLSGELKHRVTNVAGNISRTAFAGWFKSTPDLWSTLTQFSQLNHAQPAS
jgi:2OG-Fe(II) oxygenase superfamily